MEESLVVLGASKQRLSLLYFVLQFVEQLASIFMVNLNEVVLMVKHRVSKDRLYVFVGNLGLLFVAWRSQVLPTVHCQVNLGVAKLFGLIVLQ